MHFIKKFYFETIKYNLINKFIYNKQKNFSEIQNISISFSSEGNNIKKLLSGMLALELVINQKGTIIPSKNNGVSIKIHKGNPVSCKLAIKKQNLLNFLSFIIFSSLPKQKYLDKKTIKTEIKNAISYTIVDSIKVLKLEKHYYFFNNIPKLNITVITNTKNVKEINFFFKLFKIF